MADIISRLRLESGEFDSKIKRAGQELMAYSEHCRKIGLEMGYANKDAQDFARQLGSMATVSQTARGKISELSEAFVNAKVMYKNMTDEEKNSQFGKNLAVSLDQLKTRIEAAKQDFADVNKELAGGEKFGEYGNVINTLGSKLGVTGNLTEMLTSKTAMLTGAVGASIAIIGKATDSWAKYNAQLARQDQITTVTTGLKGDDANRMTDTMRALSDTYGVDFREAVNAANTLMTQFGETGDSAIRLIKDGMQGMIQGDGPKLLSMIQQYAPAFRDAGVSASQLVAVIQNSEGGIFTDQNMNAIVMGIKNIRLMTKATSDALAKLGLDGQKMSQQLSDGSMTIFDALKQVAAAIQGVNSNSQAAGEVMQQVFGRQGAMAGTKLGEAISTLNTNLEETKRQTGEVGESLSKLQEANERLNIAIRDAFGYDGWEQMANGIKSNLIGALSDVIEHLAIIREGFREIRDFFGGGAKGDNGTDPYKDVKETQAWINNGKDDNERRSRYDKAMGQLQAKLNNVGKEYQVRNSDGSISFRIDDEKTQAAKRAALERRMSMFYATSYTPPPVNNPTPTPAPHGSKTQKPNPDLDKDEFVEIIGLIGNAQERVSDLQRRMRESWDNNEIANLRTELKEAQQELDVLQGKLPKDTNAHIKIKADNTDALNTIDKTVKEIDGVVIANKTFDVTATDEALPKLREIEGVTIDDKTLTITATDEALPKLREIEGVTIDDKTLTVTANTSEALQKVQELVAKAGGEVIDIKVVPQWTDADIEKEFQRIQGEFAKQQPSQTPNMTQGQQLEQTIRANIGFDINETDMTTLTSLLEAQIKYGIEGVNIPTDELINKIMGDGLDIPDEYWQNLQDQINARLADLGIDPIKIDFKTGNMGKLSKEGKTTEDSWRAAAQAVQSVGSALQGIDDPAAKITGLIGQAIANIALGFAQASAKDSKLGVFGWIAAIAGGLGTMISTISAIHSATGYANGGIYDGPSGFVPGTSYSGDNIPANGGTVKLDSGELILNRAMQGNLASQIEGNSISNLNLTATVRGEDIRLALNNNGRRTGRGEFVQSNRRY